MKLKLTALTLSLFLASQSFALDKGTNSTSTAPSAVSASIGTSQANKKLIKIKIAHVVKANTPKGKASIRFKELLENRFPGRVSVEVYEDNKLYKDGEEIEALELGAAQIIVPTMGKAATAYGVKEFEIFDLPFLFNTNEDITKFVNSSTATKLLDIMNAKSRHAQALSIWPNDFRVYSGPKPFKTVNDFAGLTVRVESSGTMKQAYETLKVKESISLPFSELAKALKKDGEFKVDATANPPSNFLSAKLYESQPWITRSNHDYIAYAFIVNKRWFNSLPEDIKTGIVEISKEVGMYHQKVALEDSEKVLKEIEAKGTKIYNWTPQEREAFKKAMIPVHESYMKINKDFLLETYNLLRTN